VRHLQIIGEAAYALPKELRDQRSDIPWNEIIGMRHILVHDYFVIDIDIVWGAVDRDLPDIKAAARPAQRAALRRRAHQHFQHFQDQLRSQGRQVAAHQTAIGIYRRELFRLPRQPAGFGPAHGRVSSLSGVGGSARDQ
jgi:hypothetical protein